MFLLSRINVTQLCRAMSHEGADLLEMAAMIARDFLPGPWRHVNVNNIVVAKVNGGLSNWLYQMSLPATIQVREPSVPRTVLLRFHGQVNGESAFEHIVTESVVFTLLSERRLGPKLYGIFPGGRVEEFIDARPLAVSEMSDKSIALAIAEKVADVHSLTVPTCKRPTWLFDLCTKYISSLHKNQNKCQPTDARSQRIVDSLSNYNLLDELDWLKNHLEAIDSKVVFCHNDLNEGNILLPLDKSKGPNDMVLIDFEYCAYNYRSFDIANHFLEHTIEYTSEAPYFKISPTNYPSRDHQTMFIRRYLKKSGENAQRSAADQDNQNEIGVDEEEVKSLLGEVDNVRLAVHFFWALWSGANAANKIPFGYWEFFEERFDSYQALKADLESFEVPGNKRKRT